MWRVTVAWEELFTSRVHAGGEGIVEGSTRLQSGHSLSIHDGFVALGRTAFLRSSALYLSVR